MPNDPNASWFPLWALPFILPFWLLLNLVFFGCNIAQLYYIVIYLAGFFSVSTAAFSLEVACRGFAASLRRLCSQVGTQVALAVDFSVAYPNLDTYQTNFGESLTEGIVDICAEGMQWNSSVFVSFITGHFSTTKPSGYHYLDAFGSHAHRRCY